MKTPTADTITVHANDGTIATATVRKRIGPFAVHRPALSDDKPGAWHVTHTSTGTAVARMRTLSSACQLAFALSLIGGWNFTDVRDMDSGRRSQVLSLLRSFGVDDV